MASGSLLALSEEGKGRPLGLRVHPPRTLPRAWLYPIAGGAEQQATILG